MTRFCIASSFIGLAALAGCAEVPGTPLADRTAQTGWRAAAMQADADRLRGMRATFLDARAEAVAAGYGDQIETLGAIADPDAALQLGSLPDGTFRCRTIKLGSRNGTLAYVDYPFFQCRIRPEGAVHGFAKVTGSQRQVGLLFPDDAYRAVFLGTLVLGDEDRAMRYGADPERDVIGAFQRIGENEYRLLIPEPRYESQLDIIHLVQE
ncbi:DUF4893 domain-containing protein [Sphingomicrobium sp. XHP0239]|uniref:DUF4893 domain-containing protein n=1 Tax=Sphingomicrobium maritimum TaxID=3133972 RepID=UPI0031CC43EC